MEVAYGIGVKNRFALFVGDEDADPMDLMAIRREKEGDKSSDAISSASAKKGKKNVAPAAVDAKGTGGGESKAGAGGKENSATASSSSSSKTKQSQPLGSSHAAPAPGGGRREPRDRRDQGNKQGAPRPAHDSRDSEGFRSSNKGGESRQSNKPGGRQERIIRPSNNAGPGTGTATGSAPGFTPGTAHTEGGSGGGFRDRDMVERKNRRNTEPRDGERGPPTSEFRTDDGFRGPNSGRGGRGGGGVERRNTGQRGFRGGRGARGGGGPAYDNRGKREFDRHSGNEKTGVKPIEKREGSGAHNWGNFADDLEGQNPTTDEPNETGERSGDDVTPETAVEPKQEGEAAPEGDGETKEADAVEEVKEITYDEWKKSQEGQRQAPKFNLRKPGEGEDVSQWKKTTLLKKEEPEPEEDEYEEVEVEGKHGRQKKVLEIEINFKDENRRPARGGRDSRGRGSGPRGEGRGGDRGGGGRGRGADRDGGDTPRGERGERPGPEPRRGGGRGRGRDGKEQAAPKVDDYNDFPSLAAA